MMNTRGVFLSQYSDQIPKELPDTVFYGAYAPFGKLLPKSSVLVHHGGIGTCAQALKAGIPQLLVPFGLDQHDNASRIVNLGAGDEIPMKKYKSSLVATILQKLRSDTDIQSNCRKNADTISYKDPLPDICRIIEDTLKNAPSGQTPT